VTGERCRYRATAKYYRRDAENAERVENINTEDTEKSGEHRERGSLAEVLRDFAGGVVAARAGYAVAGVGAVAAEVEVFHWGGVAGPA